MPSLTLLCLLAAAPVTDVVSTLRERDQRLLDAIAPGDRAVWGEALAADAIVVDENWVIQSREEFLSQLVPLPKGVKGQIVIREYQASVSDDVALVVHRDDESEDFFGNEVDAEYLMTETWVRRNGDWKLALLHVAAVSRDPPERRMAPRELDAYVGEYGSGEGLRYVIRRNGDRLEGGRTAKSLAPLEVEVRDVLFVPGKPRSRKIFERDERGHVTGFVDRREGRDVRWKRMR